MAYHGADPRTFNSFGASRHHGPAGRGETMRIRIKLQMAMTLILCLMSGRAGAQFLQYTPPGGPEVLPESRRDELEREIAAADHHLGAVRIAPWLVLRDTAYVRSVFATGQETPDDVTATLGAGFRAYLRNGPKALWRAQVLPEYVWWARQTDRRQINGRYLLGFHGFFNRLTLEAQGGREQRQQVVTPEVPVPVSSRRDGGEVRAEVELSHALFAFTATSLTKQNHLVDEVGDPRVEQITLLDREDRIARVGLSWRPRRQWVFALGAERSQTDFEGGAFDRSNAGTAPVAELQFRGRRLSFRTDLAFRSLEARQGAAFVPYDEVTGDASVTLGNARSLSATLYANRNLTYSLSRDYPYLTDERLGLAFTVGIGSRTQAGVFAEAGNNAYTAFQAGTQRRQEDVTSYGASLDFQIAPRLSFGLQALRSEFDSNLPGGDRSYSSVGTTLNLLGGLGDL